MRAQEKIATFELSLPSQLGYEKLVRHTLAWLLPGWGLSAARTADLQTATSEACINAIEHGNRGVSELHVQVALSFTHDHVDAVVIDQGIASVPDPEPVAANIEQKLMGLAPARGMGLALIRGLVDEAGFLPPQPGMGNRFHLRVYRQP